MADLKLNTTNGSVTLKPEDGSGNVDLNVGRQTSLGKVLQVVEGVGGARVGTPSTSYVPSNLTASITPTSSTSKILVMVHTSYWQTQANYGVYNTIYRNDSIDITSSGWGDAYSANSHSFAYISMSKLDSPNTTDEVTYTHYFKSESASYIVYTPMQNNAYSTITLIEIAN